uniref:Uncharacterized protein n=1 Tax=Anguilla anguilla TaxID=7936 RepID=A0A0E9UXR6_ANGAN
MCNHVIHLMGKHTGILYLQRYLKW